MSKAQTDNDEFGFSAKVKLRIKSIEGFPMQKEIKVLECFSGHGFIWNEVKKATGRNINIVPIDSRTDKTGAYLKGDSFKFMSGMNLTGFDIIDLDAYGQPVKYMEHLFKIKYKGIVHVTFIQSGMGNLSNFILNKLGYTREMIRKTPILFTSDAEKKLYKWLRMNLVSKIYNVSFGRKHYFYYTRHESTNHTE